MVAVELHERNAIVGANLVRGVVGLAFLAVVTDWRDYLLPCRLTLETMGRIFRFGMPITIAGLFAVGAMSWDNSFMGYRFGEATVGIYNQAYRLADLPATPPRTHRLYRTNRDNATEITRSIAGFA